MSGNFVIIELSLLNFCNFPHQADSLASSLFPDFLSASEVSTETPPPDTEYSFMLDGKRECYAIKILKNYESVVQILGKCSLQEALI